MIRPFQIANAEDLAQALNAENAEYLFLGKGGAIILGYPGTTQDVDIFALRSPENGRRIVTALRKLGFTIEDQLARDLVEGRDFVQIKNGPFDVDVVFAPDGISSFAAAKRRCIKEGIFPVASLRDIIASKRASGRKKDLNELPLLESFRQEYERKHAPPLRSALNVAKDRGREP